MSLCYEPSRTVFHQDANRPTNRSTNRSTNRPTNPARACVGGKRLAVNIAVRFAAIGCALIAGYAPVGGLPNSELVAAEVSASETDVAELNAAEPAATTASQTAAKPAGDQRAATTVDFNREVRPILSKSCVKCHGPDDGFRPAGLRLDTREGATATLETGAVAIVSGDPEASELITRITLPDGDTGAMPPKGAGERLSPEQVEVLRKWIAAGAPYAKHWSLQAPTRPAVPQIAAQPGKTQSNKTAKDQPAAKDAAAKNIAAKGTAVIENHPIDAFIRQRLIAANLDLQPEAERHVLVRRLSFDLRGLPPTPEEVAEFEADTRPDAYIRLVDKMLADSAYGERWTRIWLDLARYADSAGYGSDPLRLNAWRYRDWVIDSFNQNKPYDQFTIEQIAGDLLPNATVDQRMATAFHRNTMTNTEGGTDDEEFRMAAVKDRTDTTMQVWMGLTLGCAKCHNHKFDPFTRREYYEMMAFFNQTADADRGDELPVMEAPTEEIKAKSQQIDEQIAVLRQRLGTATPELVAAQQSWEDSLQSTSEWLPLQDARVQSAAGTAFELQADGSWLATGPVTDNDTYTVTAIVDPATFKNGLTGVRLQTIPDPRLPNSGAGRASDGNFVLSRVLVQQSELAVEQATGNGSTGNTPRTIPGTTGRRVRLRMPGSDKYLHIAELEVYSQGKNVARTGTATQSSTDYGGDAARAVDGNPDGNYFSSNSVTHTRAETDPWWQVELAADTPIEEIRLYNRTDGGTQSRLNSAILEILDSAGAVVWSTAIDAVIETNKSWPLVGPQTVQIAAAAADFSQDSFAVQSAATGADLAGTGWAVAPHYQSPHAAVFAFTNPLKGTRPVELRIVLEQAYRMPQFLLGRFAIQVTSDEKLQNRNGVHAAILAIIDTPAATRTPQQQSDLANYYRSIAPQLMDVRNEIAAIEQQRPKSVTLPIMQELPEGQRRKSYVLEKANFLLPLEEVQSGTPASLHARKLRDGNRLDVANWLVDAENPLTARVAVNRFWSQLFGRGIVETEEDFGTQGALPSHPELLDWLAVEFQQPSIMRNPQGALRPWDIKGLLRLIVTSRSYRQSSRVTPVALQIDPRNVLLSRAPRYRLEAEMVRDQALALSGLLSRKIGGPSVYPVQPDGLWQAAFNGERTWSTSTGDDRYRRGLYTFWRRTVPYPSMATFDAPSREACTIRRSRTNTPLQAFVTLNDPVYVEAAQALARRIMQHGGQSVEQRLAYGLQLCTCRRPPRAQVERLQSLYQTELAWYQVNESAAVELATIPLGPLPAGQPAAEAAAWTVVANVLLNLDGVLTRN